MEGVSIDFNAAELIPTTHSLIQPLAGSLLRPGKAGFGLDRQQPCNGLAAPGDDHLSTLLDAFEIA